ncbi:39S ribosomal protein L22, mitochondrial-like [Acanthaster planci]|uniref:Large ribosomal subunit protein uL22m n=1 Tax=Acanthaster planci TaxID=133434 RepID=A0A8B7XW97_ACAPL|nr:39S ribosomal protein L22, mitochondrial-like [Acanthaster planci]
MASFGCFKSLSCSRRFAVNVRKAVRDVGLLNFRKVPRIPASVACVDDEQLGRSLFSLPASERSFIASSTLVSGADQPLLNLTTTLSGRAMCIDRCLHTSSYLAVKAWERRNKKVYPPQKPGEPPRKAEVYYSRRQIKHSMRKMWYIAKFVKGMMIDDALTQLQFIDKKSAKIAREVLLEAQEEAVKNHNVEFKSNLHIADAFVGKGEYDHAMRIHAKGRFSILDLVYSHFFVCLREGPPPKEVETTGYDQAQHYIDSLRKRTITHSV